MLLLEPRMSSAAHRRLADATIASDQRVRSLAEHGHQVGHVGCTSDHHVWVGGPSGGEEAAQGWVTHGWNLSNTYGVPSYFAWSLPERIRSSRGLLLRGLQSPAVFSQVDGADGSESLKSGK